MKRIHLLALGLLITPLFATYAEPGPLVASSSIKSDGKINSIKKIDQFKGDTQRRPLAGGRPPRQWNTGYFGIYGGLNVNRVSQTNTTPADKPVDWQAGVYGRTGGVLFWQLGVEYRRVTTYYPLSGSSLPTNGAADEVVGQNLLVFPTFLGLRFGTKVGFHLQAGAEVTTLLSTVYVPNAIGANNLRRSNYFGVGGGGIHAGPITLDILYHQGMQSIYTDGSDGTLQLLTLSLGCRF